MFIGSSDWINHKETKDQDEWDGKGFPPIGYPCEAAINHIHGPEGREVKTILWIPGRVIAYHPIKDKLYAWFAEDDGSFYQPAVLSFRKRQ